MYHYFLCPLSLDLIHFSNQPTNQPIIIFISFSFLLFSFLYRNNKLDVLIGDTAILDYYRANDPGCNLRLLGDSIFDDAYAIGMQKGFPFRVSY